VRANTYQHSNFWALTDLIWIWRNLSGPPYSASFLLPSSEIFHIWLAGSNHALLSTFYYPSNIISAWLKLNSFEFCRLGYATLLACPYVQFSSNPHEAKRSRWGEATWRETDLPLSTRGQAALEVDTFKSPKAKWQDYCFRSRSLLNLWFPLFQ
jgi:hypothetical protein